MISACFRTWPGGFSAGFQEECTLTSGWVQGLAHDLLRLRKNLSAEGVAILADVDVKHSAPLAKRPIADEIEDVIKRGHADAIIVSGSATGASVDAEQLAEAVLVAGSTPVFIGSGATADSINALREQAAGFIVGTAVKSGGDVHNPVDPARVREIASSIN